MENEHEHALSRSKALTSSRDRWTRALAPAGPSAQLVSRWLGRSDHDEGAT